MLLPLPAAVLAPFLMALGLCLFGVPPFLGWMRRLGWGQEIRQEGPSSHLSKKGTPTMGGLVLILAALLATSWWPGSSPSLWLFRGLMLAGALLGLADDLNKVLRRRNLGLRARHKLAIQILLGLGAGWWVARSVPTPGVQVPLLGFVAGAWVVLLLSVGVVAGTMNAVNLTDGLDGLAAGTVALAAAAYVPIAWAAGHPELCVGAAGVVGACLGFLWFNCYPARVFMGDTGAMGLGGALAALALLTRGEFLLLLIGGVFVAEALSVILQVGYFKLTRGRRLFRMSPLHHHFEHCGLHEVQVTTRFWVVGALLAALGLAVYFRPGGLGL